MGIFRRREKRTFPPYLDTRAHWRIAPVRDLSAIFGNLLRLLPEGGMLCLAAGCWSKEGRGFIEERALPPDEARPLPRDFARAPGLRLDIETLMLLSDMATRHAAPELAVHLGCYEDGVSLLEWYDLPDDPISVPRSVPEARVAAFAEACGVTYEAR